VRFPVLCLAAMLAVPVGCKKADPCVEFETACTTWCEGDERAACLEEASSLQSAGVATACYDAHLGLTCSHFGGDTGDPWDDDTEGDWDTSPND